MPAKVIAVTPDEVMYVASATLWRAEAFNYRHRAMTCDGRTVRIIDANDERQHDCGWCEEGFSCWISAPKAWSKTRRPEDQP